MNKGKLALDIVKSYGFDLTNPLSVLKGLDLLKNFQAAKTEDERRKVIKTLLRTLLPFPLSLATGEILIQLRRLVKPLDKLIKTGV